MKLEPPAMSDSRTERLPASPMIHGRLVRLTHWVNALAFLVLLLSGWKIYNASPVFAFRLPGELTLGGWLGGALLWHFAAMWLLALNGLLYLGYGFLSGHFRRKLWPVSPTAVWADIRAALSGRLAHDDLSVYNAAQRAAYIALILGIGLLALSGLAIWKPVQLAPLVQLFGGFDTARVVHFVAMTLTLVVAAVHVLMVVLVPRTLLAMLIGRLPAARSPQ